MLARRPPSVFQAGRARAAPSCRPLLAAVAPARPRRSSFAAQAAADDSGSAGNAPLATATTEPSSPSSPNPTTSTTTWEDLYIIPSSFSDDDEGDYPEIDAKTTTASTPVVRAWPTAGPIVILPGFGNDTQDYEAPFGDSRKGLAPRLRRRGFIVETVRLRRRDWLRVAKAIASPAYWRGEADVGPGYRWYLLRVAAAVKRAEEAWVEQHGNDSPPPKVTLVGHSAGGWLARAFLGDASLRTDAVAEAARKEEERALQAMAEATKLNGGIKEALATVREVFFSRSLAIDEAGEKPLPCRERPHPAVGAVVTLGTPHTPPVGKSARDVTGGALAWVNEQWPGAFFGGGGGKGAGSSSSKIVYVTVAGRAVLAPSAEVVVPRGSPPSYAREAYRTVAGDLVLVEEGENGSATTTVEGDAVVPLIVASEGLPGADARVVLDGVWHSMSKLGTFKEAPSGGGGAGADQGGGRVRPWYGSGGALDAWLAALRDVQQEVTTKGLI